MCFQEFVFDGRMELFKYCECTIANMKYNKNICILLIILEKDAYILYEMYEI